MDNFKSFCILSAYRLIRSSLESFAEISLAPVPLSKKPIYSASNDVSIVVPTINVERTFADTLETWLAQQPHEILIVTTTHHLRAVKATVAAALPHGPNSSATRLSVISIPHPSKRQQMAHGIARATGSIIVLADDDVFWPPKLVPLILPCFERPQVGGVGTLQRARLSADTHHSIWERLAARRLRGRNRSITSANYLDGGVQCLSGRTAAYRASILQDAAFLYEFTHDYWWGRYLLDTGDDTFITRWLFSKRWEIWIQKDQAAEIETLVLDSPRYVRQLLRWRRNSVRSYWRCIFGIRGLWRRHPFVVFTMIEVLMQPLIDSLELYYALMSLLQAGPALCVLLLSLYISTQLLQRGLSSLKFLCASVIGDALTVPLYLYAYATMNETSWGSHDPVRAYDPGEAADRGAKGRIVDVADAADLRHADSAS